MVFVIILSTLILNHAKNISISFRAIIIKNNLFNRLNRNTANRVICLLDIHIINFARLFYSTIVLRKSSFFGVGFFLVLFLFSQ